MSLRLRLRQMPEALLMVTQNQKPLRALRSQRWLQRQRQRRSQWWQLWQDQWEIVVGCLTAEAIPHLI